MQRLERIEKTEELQSYTEPLEKIYKSKYSQNQYNKNV